MPTNLQRTERIMEKITILILMANPNTTAALSLEKELSKILEALNESSEKLKFEVISCYAASTNNLHKEFRKYQPQIVHFSGHGAGDKGLIFEDEGKNLQLASTKALAGLFKLFKDTIGCVILNACHSETQVEEIHRYVNCVIGMNQAIGDNAAIEFSRGFYESLSFGDSFERAYEFGCNAIELLTTSESETPIIKIKERNAAPMPKPSSKPEPKPSVDDTSAGKGGNNTNLTLRDNSGQIVTGNSNTVNQRSSEVS